MSVSLGQSCVFLLGGKTKETEPTAMLLRSGDVVILSGEARRCYHGVPRIVRVSHPKRCHYSYTGQCVAFFVSCNLQGNVKA